MLVSKLVLMVVAFIFSLILGECLLFLLVGGGSILEGEVWTSFNDRSDLYEPDQELGFKPVFDGIYYDQYGTMVTNDRSASAKGDSNRRQILFLGDSVTRRRKIEQSMISVLDPKREVDCWNAGVESYNTVQEVAYYKRYCSALKPDHVILTFHPNDFGVTPVAFQDSDGSFRVVAPDHPRGCDFNPWLFEHSFIYRLWFELSQDEHNHEIGEANVRRSLSEIAALLAQSETEFTVLILPSILPFEQWSQSQLMLHERALQIMNDLGIKYYNLLPALKKANRNGIKLQEKEGDWWHPSLDLAKCFAWQLKIQKFEF